MPVLLQKTEAVADCGWNTG